MGAVQMATRDNAFKTVRPSPIKFSTDAPGLVSGTMHPKLREEQAEVQSVALANPDHRGNPDPRAGEPLYQLCLAMRLRDELYHAGVEYATIVHRHRILLGFGYGNSSAAEVGSQRLTDAEHRANCEAARIKRDQADYALRGVHKRAVSAMTRLCVEEQPCLPYDEDLSKHSLWALAVHFGMVKLGINAEKRA